MKNRQLILILCTMLLLIGCIETIEKTKLMTPPIGQEIIVPEKITISDKITSDRAKRLIYKYVLELNETDYDVYQTSLQENGKLSSRNTLIGKIDKKIITAIVEEISRNHTNEINPTDFTNVFSKDTIRHYLEEETDKHWIRNEYQKQFIIEQLSQPKKLKSNLEQFFKYYDGSGSIHRSWTDVEIKFHYDDTTLFIKSTSFLPHGLPLVINGETNFSPRLATLIGDLIPQSKTNRPDQFKGDQLFSLVTSNTFRNHHDTIENLQSKTYQVHLDSLKQNFKVSKARVVNSMYSINWEGEKRLNCELQTASMIKNVSFNYSTIIDNYKVKYPVSFIISDHEELYKQVISVTFFKDYLENNTKRKLSIIYDDTNCFTRKTRYSISDHCIYKNIKIDFDTAIFIRLEDEFGKTSGWGLLPNGQYFMWSKYGDPPIPNNDINYLTCTVS